MARDMTYVEWGEYKVEECYKCGVRFGMTKRLHETLQKEGPQQSFWCPNGHSQVYTESTADKLRRERDLLKQQMAQKDDEIRAEQQRAEKAEQESRRLRKRAQAGACPCCKRTFTNMARHMKTKHPEIVPFKKTA